MNAFTSYTPRAYPGTVTLFLSKETTAAYTKDPVSEWKVLAEQGIVVHEVLGEEGEMLKEPFVQVVAEKLKESLLDARKQFEN